MVVWLHDFGLLPRNFVFRDYFEPCDQKLAIVR